mgnify:CR=1 FL=1
MTTCGAMSRCACVRVCGRDRGLVVRKSPTNGSQTVRGGQVQARGVTVTGASAHLPPLSACLNCSRICSPQAFRSHIVVATTCNCTKKHALPLTHRLVWRPLAATPTGP